ANMDWQKCSGIKRSYLDKGNDETRGSDLLNSSFQSLLKVC
ncbi:transcriptional regulator LeuO, partial [Shigella dysenteriae]